MKTKTLSTITLAVSLFALAGCGSDSNDDDGGGTTPPPATTSGDTAGGGGNIPPNSGGGDSGSSATIFDRMGRPGISTALVAAADRKDAYNLAGNPDTWSASFRANLEERIRIIDGLDGTFDNALTDAGSLADLLVDDRLQIDTSMPECDAYLALEISLEGGGCGGRTLERDVIDDTLRHLVSQGMPVSDLANVDGSTSTVWPFLGEPNLGGDAQ